jgi:hypothetical protein
MDIITQRFVAIGNRLLAQLRRLSDSIQQRIQAERERQHSEQEQQRGDVITCIRDAVQSIAKSQEAAHHSKKWYKDRTFLVSVAGVVVVIAYATVTYFMWLTMNTTYKASVESFRIDERAWVEIEPIKPVIISQADAKFPTGFTCSIYPKNVGKTVATNIVVKAQPLGAAQQFSAEQMRNTQDKYLLDKFKESGTNNPVVVPSNPAPKVLSPNTIANAPFTLGCQAIKAYPSGGAWYEFIVGRIDYCDAFHVRHWKTFCFFVANSRGDVWNCQEGNEEDNNPEIEPTEKCSK